MLMLKDAAHEKSTTVKKKRRRGIRKKKKYEKLVVSSPTPTIEHLQILRDLSSAPFWRYLRNFSVKWRRGHKRRARLASCGSAGGAGRGAGGSACHDKKIRETGVRAPLFGLNGIRKKLEDNQLVTSSINSESLMVFRDYTTMGSNQF